MFQEGRVFLVNFGRAELQEELTKLWVEYTWGRCTKFWLAHGHVPKNNIFSYVLEGDFPESRHIIGK